MAPLDGLKALWNDPKKKPLVIAGVAVAGTAGVLAMKRPVDEGEAAAEDQVAETEAGAVDTGPFGGLGEEGAGYLPPVLVAGGGYGGGFGDMGETDFSSVYAELDNIGSQLNDDLAQKLAAERAARNKANKKGRRRDVAQDKKIAAQRRRIRKLQKRTKQRARPKGKRSQRRRNQQRKRKR